MSLHSFYRAAKATKAPYLHVRRANGRGPTSQLCHLSSESSGCSKTRLDPTDRTRFPSTTVTKLIEKVFPTLKLPEADDTNATNESDSELTPQELGTWLHSRIEIFLEPG